MKAIILAAGEGKRMRPLTLSVPKPMIEVLGKPLLHRIIESLPEEITELIVVVGYKKEHIEHYFGSLFEGRSIRYVVQEKIEGQAHALLLCKKFINPGERFLFLFADDLHSPKALKELLHHPRGVLVQVHPHPARFGVVTITREGRVLGIEEKPDRPTSNLVVTGAYVLDSHIFDYVPTRRIRGEYYLADQINELIRDHEVVIEKTDFWHPIGYPHDVTKAEEIVGAATGTPLPQSDVLVVILAGGRGTRMPEREQHLQKILVVVAGKPILEHQIENLFRQGFRNIRLSLGHKAHDVIAWLAAKKFFDIGYTVETEPLGTGGGIKRAASGAQKPFLVLNGDVLADFDFRSALRASGGGAYGVISVVEAGDVSGMGVIVCDEHKRMCSFKEKEAEKVPGLVSAGLYVLRPEDIASMPDSFSIEHELFPRVALDGKFVVHEHRGNYWFDCGTEERLARVREYFEK